MKFQQFKEGVGRIVKGVNTTPDVGPDEIKKQAAKFGFKVDKDGRPKQHSNKTKGKSTNVLFNLGLAESVAIKFERGEDYDILHIKEKGKNRVEVRGKKGYESGNYDSEDKLHQVLDKLGKAANMSELMNGETVVLNPKHPDGPRAIKTVTSECPRTKAALCQCESIKSLSEAQETLTAVCVLEHSETVKGTILFKQQAQDPTIIVGKITGLEPGEHGFHVHEFGDLSNGCESAGAHFNPDGVDHGDIDEGHVGDLGNVTADDNGVADIRIIAKRISLTGERSIVGRAIVVHKDKDDLGKGGDEESLKTGNAGDRLACGVITLKETVSESIKEEENELSQETEIFVDMDGVLADFFGAWKKLIGKDWRNISDIDDALQRIRDKDDFWLKIPKTENAMNLLGLIKQLKGKYNILSAPLANDPNSEPHKREWIAKNLKAFPPNNVYITADKAKFATQSDGTPNILIDDFGQNINKWTAAGGVGFKHKDHKFERTVKNLAQHMKGPAKETYARDELPQIGKKELDNIWHTKESLAVKDIIPVQKERIQENYAKQLRKIASGNYAPIVVDCENKIINGHHRYDIIKKLAVENVTVIKLPLYLENFADGKKNEGAEITMWTNPEYQGADVDDKYYKKQPVKIVDVSKLTPFEPADKMDPKDNHDNMMRFVDKIKAGKKLKPIVIVPHEGKWLIVDGHHRYFAHLKAGADKIRVVIADPKDLTWRDDVPESLKENFADGKKKGKSRPGRVKRAGASCNGSVTELRKRAKNASGEKAKMYHWCANMKSGKKKGK